ncbi:MAG TPA: hypothetical protein VMU56_06995 [Beijerinckiaceae bacterium]|nr:hypothetical protein [Beijerinckiaceae bacterium]
MTAAIEVKPVETARDRADWLAIPAIVHAGDPAFVPPLLMQESRRISPRHNPFFKFGEAQLFIARRNGSPIGRVSAQINRRYLDRHNDKTGHFGFFDCVDDQEAADLLLDAACRWLSTRGMERAVGPLNFSVNEEIGLLVEGFDSPPAILMTQARPWEGSLVENAGFEKEIDVLAWRMKPSVALPAVKRLSTLAPDAGRLSVRPFNMKNYRAEVATLIDIFNDAWSDNWGFVPFSDPEIDALVAEMRPFFRGNYGRFVCLDGEPVGTMLALPNINESIAGFGGRLAPLKWAFLLRDLWMERIRTARIPLLGLRKAHRHTTLAPAMIALLVSEFLSESRRYPLDWVEFSWILETNRAMVGLAQLAAGAPAKRYRIYRKTIPAA